MALPCRNSREPVSNVSLKYAVEANVHAHVKTSYQTQQAAIHDTNRPGLFRNRRLTIRPAHAEFPEQRHDVFVLLPCGQFRKVLEAHRRRP